MKRKKHTNPQRRRAHRRPVTTRIRSLAAAVALAMMAALLPLGLFSPAQGAIVGQGFSVTPADLAFILKQIKIAEAHVAAGPGPAATDPVNCQAMIGTGPNQIESPLLTLGLRTVDGTCNNLQKRTTQEKYDLYGASDQTFPRLTTPEFNAAEDATAFGGPACLLLRADDRSSGRLRAPHGQQPDRRPDLEQPRGHRSRANPVRSQSGALVFCTGRPF